MILEDWFTRVRYPLKISGSQESEIQSKCGNCSSKEVTKVIALLNVLQLIAYNYDLYQLISNSV